MKTAVKSQPRKTKERSAKIKKKKRSGGNSDGTIPRLTFHLLAVILFFFFFLHNWRRNFSTLVVVFCVQSYARMDDL